MFIILLNNLDFSLLSSLNVSLSHCQLSQLIVICEQQPKAISTSRVQGLSHLVHVPSQFLVPYVGMHYRHL